MRSSLFLLSSTAALLSTALVSGSIAADGPRPPVLLGSSFLAGDEATPRPGQRIGHAIAIDLDADERHHFELLAGDAFLRIDPSTGELFLRDDVDPTSVAGLEALVRVTDRNGLSARMSYRVRLNQSPPPPPLPVLLADATDPPEPDATAADTTPMGDRQIDTKASAGDVTTRTAGTGAVSAAETSAGQTTAEQMNTAAVTTAPPAEPAQPAPRVDATTVAASPAVATNAPVPDSSEQTQPPRAQTWFSGALEALASITRPGDDRTGWLITAAVVMCVLVIVVSGIQNAVVAGREPGDAPQQTADASADPHTPPAPRLVSRSAAEVSDILARLDAVIGHTEHAAGEGETDHSPALVAATQTAPVGGQLPPAHSPLQTVDEPAAAATVATAVLAAPPAATAEADPATEAEFELQQHAVADPERQRIEQFRQISRMMNRADIDRHHRERMREEWLSAGVTALACLVTGTVCVFTSCFGNMSIPLGSVMFSVATVLLMRPSLYSQTYRPPSGK